MPVSALESTLGVSQPAVCFTNEEVEQFRREGYVIARGLGDRQVLATMLAATFDGLAREIEPIEYEADLHYPGAPDSRQAQGGRTVRRLKQAHARHPIFTEWLTQPAFLTRVHQLLGPEVVMPLAHHNCIMTKQPHFSSDTGWHQDIRYWSFERPELVSAWLSLVPESPDNGCLKLIPGSHRQEYDRSRFDDELFLRPELPENRALIEQSVYAELQPGDVLFFHCRTFHSATRNHTPDPKYSVVFTFRPASCRPIAGSRSAALPELILPRGEIV
jgi:phytanoyl-CoA hydroxylase